MGILWKIGTRLNFDNSVICCVVLVVINLPAAALDNRELWPGWHVLFVIEVCFVKYGLVVKRWLLRDFI